MRNDSPIGFFKGAISSVLPELRKLIAAETNAQLMHERRGFPKKMIEQEDDEEVIVLTIGDTDFAVMKQEVNASRVGEMNLTLYPVGSGRSRLEIDNFDFERIDVKIAYSPNMSIILTNCHFRSVHHRFKDEILATDVIFVYEKKVFIPQYTRQNRS